MCSRVRLAGAGSPTRSIANGKYEAHQAGVDPVAAHDRASCPSDDDLYGHSPAMREVMTLVQRAASMRAGVLISGEEGTGRQVAARAIHGLGPNTATGSAPAAVGPFVAVDCAAYDGDELDAALFGAPAVSSDGESSRGLERISRHGRLYAAIGGTLYLQNIAEAPTRVQARLARVLRDREAMLAAEKAERTDRAERPEKGEKADRKESVALDIRPMAGVDPGFDAAVEDGRVRDDLFRRLSVIRIDMPSLRNRREDIPALANHFLRDICASLRVPPKTISRPALALISALPWRGNAVELRALLEAVVTGLQGGRGIGLEDMLTHVKLDGGSSVFTHSGTLKQARSRFERDYIAAVLDQHRGRISDAAKALGIQRTNLYRKMRSLRVSRASGVKNDTQ